METASSWPVEIGLRAEAPAGQPATDVWFPLTECTFDPTYGLMTPGLLQARQQVMANRQAAAEERARQQAELAEKKRLLDEARRQREEEQARQWEEQRRQAEEQAEEERRTARSTQSRAGSGYGRTREVSPWPDIRIVGPLHAGPTPGRAVTG